MIRREEKVTELPKVADAGSGGIGHPEKDLLPPICSEELCAGRNAAREAGPVPEAAERAKPRILLHFRG